VLVELCSLICTVILIIKVDVTEKWCEDLHWVHVGGLYKHRNECLGSIKGRKYAVQKFFFVFDFPSFCTEHKFVYVKVYCILCCLEFRLYDSSIVYFVHCACVH
jgi:hypothetical protein